MAKRNREAALKRARERARQEKKEAKRERQAARQSDDEPDQPVNEQALMEEFARLSERYESGQVSNDRYDEERRRIFVELGIEDDS